MLDAINAAHPFECIMVTNHVWWPAPADTFYLANTTENTARVNYYGVNGVPQVYIDGMINGGSSGPWEQMMFDRLGVESPLTIVVSGEMLSSMTGQITAQITNTSSAAVSGNLHFVLIENACTFSGKTYNYVMRDYIPNDTSGEQISLGPGEEISRTAPFTLKTFWHRQNLAGLVYVQDDGTHEVYQAGRIYFEFDQPELEMTAERFDDSGGDGDGHCDPGESVNLTAELGDLNPVPATSVSGTLSSQDPHVTILDADCSWPDIASGGREWNESDPAGITIDPNTPWGYVANLSLAVTAAGGYSTTIPVVCQVGAPEDPTGPDGYGYFAYEDSDPYPPSPYFTWMEIDPNLGGPGTLLALGDDQTVNFAMPFEVKYYGASFVRLSVCSNGLIAPGIVSGTFAGNGPIPGTTGPPNMIAGFWTDLDPSQAGGGKVYQYYDSANHRYVVEFSRVRHYGSSTTETFEFFVRDPAYNQTPTGDGPIDVQYLEVGDASGCVVGIQNQARTIGIQYWNNGVPNAAAQGVAPHRAITFTTMPINGASVPEDPARTPAATLLAQPNPTRGGVVIRYDLPVSGKVSLRVFDVEGALIRTLFDEQRPAGAGTAVWDGRSDRGRDLPAGTYFYRLTGPGFEVGRKLVRR